jgi:hypothetical protein
MGTIIVCIIVTAFAYVTINYFWNPLDTTGGVITTPEGEVKMPEEWMQYFYQHGGELTINVPMYWSYDDAAQTTFRPAVKIFHADKKSLMINMDQNTTSGSGDLWISDEGILYMVLDMGTATSYYLDTEALETQGGDYVVTRIAADEFISGGDYDSDGVIEYYYELDVKSLAKTDDLKQRIYVNLYCWKTIATPSITSLLNVTACPHASWNYHTAELYVSGTTWSEGYAIKLSKIRITWSSSGTNRTDVFTDGIIQTKQVIINGIPYTPTSENSASGWQDFEISDDYLQESACPMVVFERGLGSTFAHLDVKIYANMGAASEVQLGTLTVYWINPAGTRASVTQNFMYTADS